MARGAREGSRLHRSPTSADKLGGAGTGFREGMDPVAGCSAATTCGRLIPSMELEYSCGLEPCPFCFVQRDRTGFRTWPSAIMCGRVRPCASSRVVKTTFRRPMARIAAATLLLLSGCAAPPPRPEQPVQRDLSNSLPVFHLNGFDHDLRLLFFSYSFAPAPGESAASGSPHLCTAILAGTL